MIEIFCEELLYMSCGKSMMSFVKGMGMGLMVGAITGAAGYHIVHKNKRGIKRNVGKALRNMGALVDNVTDMM